MFCCCTVLCDLCLLFLLCELLYCLRVVDLHCALCAALSDVVVSCFSFFFNMICCCIALCVVFVVFWLCCLCVSFFLFLFNLCV